jgi:hypothetical protein
MAKRIPLAKTPAKKSSAKKSASKNADAELPSPPKTTRPDASSRRNIPEATVMAAKGAVEHRKSKTSSGVAVEATAPAALAKKKGGIKGRTLDAMPDRIDIRDWPYQPTLQSLPHTVISIGEVPAILDQGDEGACTGFALAGVINHQLAKSGIKRRVSPRMLYEMARKYDEWPGEKYEGSSARGAMIGWTRHGVCEESLWPAEAVGRRQPDTGSGEGCAVVSRRRVLSRHPHPGA